MNFFKVYLIRLLYKLLGAERSSLLANGVLGQILLRLRYGNSDKQIIFSSNEGIKLKLTPKESALLGLLYFGNINPLETRILKKILKKGDLFIDVGAYIDGWHSLLASKLVGNAGKVYAFEPHPFFFARLKKNVELNNLRNIKLERFAVSDKSGKRNFFPAENISSFFEKHANATNKNPKPIQVKTVTLDKYVTDNKLSKINLIKIDVECAEMMVLEGAKNILAKKHAPDLLIEVVNHYLEIAGTSEKKLISYLKAFGYNAYSISHEGLLPYNKAGFINRSLNLYFSKKSL